MECADSIKIVLYLTLLCVVPSHYCAVSVVLIKGKCLIRAKKVSMHVRQDGVMIPKLHKVSVHKFLFEWLCPWKAVCSRDAFIWRFWHTSVIIDVL